MKGLRYVKDESRGLNCDSTSGICQDVLKSDNLLHKWSFVDSQFVTTVVPHFIPLVFDVNYNENDPTYDAKDIRSIQIHLA